MGFCFGIRRAVASGLQSLRSAWTRVLAVSGSAALAEHRTTSLSAVAATVLLSWTPLLSLDTVISGTSLRANQPIAEASRELPPQPTPPLYNSRNLLAMDASAFVQFLKTARPEPVSAENKAHASISLPEEGEVTKLNAAARQKLAALVDVLRATDRDSVYNIKVIAVPQAAVAVREPSSSSRNQRLLCSKRTNSRPWWRTRSATDTSGRNASVPSGSLTAAVSRTWSSCAMPSPS